MKRFFVTLTAFLLIAVFTAPMTVEASNAYTSDKADLLAAYIGGCEDARDLSSMTAVGAVILNRCSAKGFPDTISANGASLGILPSLTPSPMAKYAARLALAGLDPTSGALTFFTTDEAPSHPNDYVTYSASGLCFVK